MLSHPVMSGPLWAPAPFGVTIIIDVMWASLIFLPYGRALVVVANRGGVLYQSSAQIVVCSLVQLHCHSVWCFFSGDIPPFAVRRTASTPKLSQSQARN